MWDFVKIWSRLLPGNQEIMVHLHSAVVSVTLILSKPLLTCMYELTLYITSQDVYTIYKCIYTHNHMLITSDFASSLKETNGDAL